LYENKNWNQCANFSCQHLYEIFKNEINILTSDANNSMNYESCKLKSIIVQAMKLQQEKKNPSSNIWVLTSMPCQQVFSNYWKVQMKNSNEVK